MKWGFVYLTLCISAWGQVFPSAGPTVNNAGQSVPGIMVVCATKPAGINPPSECSSRVQTYTDATLATPCTLTQVTNPVPPPGPVSGTGCTNPGSSDSRGNYFVFAANGLYYLDFYGYQIRPYVMPFQIGGTGGGTNTGFGTVVTSSIQSAITAVAGGASAPVVVPSTFSGSTSFTNSPSPVPIFNFLKSPNGDYDKNGVRPVDIFGVKHDGQAVTCTPTAGSTTMSCFNQTNPFTQADVGKLVLIYGAGPSSGPGLYGGVVAGTAVTASGGTGGTAGVQSLVSTNGGCQYPMRGWVTVGVGGTIAPGSAVSLWFGGYGCTSLPTTATVATVTGSVTLSGANWIHVDLPTTITAVQSTNTITLATAPTVSTGSQSILYGSDDYLALTAACNGHNLAQNGGHYTHTGISMISQGVVCDGNNTWIQGSGWAPLSSSGGGSTLVYAGTNPNGTDGIWISSDGWGAMLTDFGLRGNSMALPRGLVISQGNTPRGTGNSANGIFTRLWIGWMWGDGVGPTTVAGASGVQLSKGVYADVAVGNGDFNKFDTIYINGAVHGVDGNNDQATNWQFVTNLQVQNSFIGFCEFNASLIANYYTETNQADIQLGSCTVGGSGAPKGLIIQSYGGESSAQNIIPGVQGNGTAVNGPILTIHSGGSFQPAKYLDPSGVVIDLTGPINSAAAIVLGDGANIFAIGQGPGGQTAKVKMPAIYGGAFGPTMIFNGIQQNQLITPPYSSDGCGGICGNSSTNPFTINGNKIYSTTTDYQTNPAPWQQSDFLGTVRDFGSLSVLSAKPPGQTDFPTTPVYGGTLTVVGNPGSTTYNYQYTCSDQAGNETAPAPTVTGGSTPYTATITNGPATLNTTNYTVFTHFWQMRGCAYYNYYGNEGSGALGYLTTLSSIQLAAQNMAFNDQGQYTKNTSRIPPVTTQSGALTVQGPTTLNNATVTGNLTVTGTVTPPVTLSSGSLTTQNMMTFTESNSSGYSGDVIQANVSSGGVGSFSGNFIDMQIAGLSLFTVTNAGTTVQTGGQFIETANGIPSGTSGYKQITWGDIGSGYSYYPTSFWTGRRAPIAFTWASSAPGGASGAGDDIGMYGVMFGLTTSGSTANYGKDTFQMDMFSTDTSANNVGNGAGVFRAFSYANGASIGGINVVAQTGDHSNTGYTTSSSQAAEFDVLNYGTNQGTAFGSGSSTGLDVVCGDGTSGEQNCTVAYVMKDDGTHHFHIGLLEQAAAGSMDWAIVIPNDINIGAYNNSASGVLGLMILGTSNNLQIGPDSGLSAIEYGPTGSNFGSHSQAVVCVKTDGKSFGYCSSVVASGGTCTCN